MMKKGKPRYDNMLKADEVEEWLARVFLRPVASRVVNVLYDKNVHSVHVTGGFLLIGLTAAWLIIEGSYISLVLAALLVQVKSILDAVDGQLARARKSPSRVGRFFDSAADFIVGFLLIMACAFFSLEQTGNSGYLYIGIAAFLFSEIQNSFWVYYNVYYRNLILGRDESILAESKDEVIYPFDEDKREILKLLRGFYWIAYRWQDRLIAFMDVLSKRVAGVGEADRKLWYRNVQFLKMSGPLGLGTNLFVMSMALVLGEPSYYLVFVLCFSNALMVLLALYHILSFTLQKRP
jgi:hypothetical protein